MVVTGTDLPSTKGGSRLLINESCTSVHARLRSRVSARLLARFSLLDRVVTNIGVFINAASVPPLFGGLGMSSIHAAKDALKQNGLTEAKQTAQALSQGGLITQ